MSENIDKLIRNKINEITINNEQLCNYLRKINFNEVIVKYINKIKDGNENKKLEHIVIKVFDNNNKFIESICYSTSVLLSIGSNKNLCGKEGDTRIIEGFVELNRFSTVSQIIEYEEKFDYDYIDYKNGWYAGGKYTFKALNIKKEIKNEKFFIVTLAERKILNDWDFNRIDNIVINIYINNT